MPTRNFLLFLPAGAPNLRAVLSYYSATANVNAEGDVHINDTLQGFGKLFHSEFHSLVLSLVCSLSIAHLCFLPAGKISVKGGTTAREYRCCSQIRFYVPADNCSSHAKTVPTSCCCSGSLSNRSTVKEIRLKLRLVGRRGNQQSVSKPRDHDDDGEGERTRIDSMPMISPACLTHLLHHRSLITC